MPMFKEVTNNPDNLVLLIGIARGGGLLQHEDFEARCARVDGVSGCRWARRNNSVVTVLWQVQRCVTS